MKSIILLLGISLCSVFALAQDCTTVTITGGNGQITISGISGAPIAGVQVFNSSWASVFNQSYPNPSSTIIVSPLPAGQYFVNVRYYSAAWAILCEKGGNATVTSGPPPAAQTCGGTYAKTFGTTGGDDQVLGMAKTSDGNVIAVGQVSATGTGNYDGLVMKMDKAGNLLWSRTLGGAQQDYFTAATATADGGCLATGAVNSTGFETYSGDCWLVRFDGNGNVLWQKRYFINGSAGSTNTIIQTSDGGFALSGTFPFTPGASDWMVLKLDANGNIQWQKKLGSNNSDGAIGMVEDNHGTTGLVISGIIYIGSFYDAMITKLDMSGNVLWTKTYDFDTRSNWLLAMYKVSDGFIYQTLNESGWNRENATPGVLKTDFNGNIIWNKEFTIPNCRESRITVLPDESIIMAQSEFPREDPATDIYMTRISPAGNVMWSKKYARPNGQFLMGLVADGNYAVGGGFTVANTYKDILITRVETATGKMGNCSAVDVTTTPRTPVATPIAFNWIANTALTLSTAVTTYTAAAYSPVETVLCSDPCPTVTISSPTVNENAGNAVLQVCIGSPATSDLVYSYVTANGTATSGADYTGGAGTVTIQAGQTCGTISIPIINDADVESAENFTVSIGAVSGTVTINDDDQALNTCNGVTVTPGDNKITVTGVTAPVATVQVFNSSWATVFNQTYTNSPGTVNVNINPGTYLVKVTFYNANWAYVCDKTVDNVTVINTCPAGTICVTNTCPSVSVNLNTAYAIPNLPAGATVTWHTGTPATDANKMTDAEAQNVTVSGTYYAAINIGSCYSATIPVKVTIAACSVPSMETRTVQLASEDSRIAKNITAFPNPFTRSVRVVIDSEKREKATIALMDMQGRQLKQVPVQLVPGSNTVLLENLDQFASGNYFLRISSDKETKTLKLVRQQ